MIDHERPLPPIEEELYGKDWRTLYALAHDYYNKALRKMGGLPFEELFQNEQRVVGALYIRYVSIEHQADILRAAEILQDPNASEEDLSFARQVRWLYWVDSTFCSRVPTDPRNRAIVRDQNGNGKRREPTEEEVEDYTRWYRENAEAILQEVLNDLPDPTGKRYSIDEFFQQFEWTAERPE